MSTERCRDRIRLCRYQLPRSLFISTILMSLLLVIHILRVFTRLSLVPRVATVGL